MPPPLPLRASILLQDLGTAGQWKPAFDCPLPECYVDIPPPPVPLGFISPAEPFLWPLPAWSILSVPQAGLPACHQALKRRAPVSPFRPLLIPAGGGGRDKGQLGWGCCRSPPPSPPAGPPPSANPIGLLPCHFDEEDYTARHCPAGLATSSPFRISRALHAKPTKGCTCQGGGGSRQDPRAQLQ